LILIKDMNLQIFYFFFFFFGGLHGHQR